MNKKIYITLLFLIFNIQNIYAGGLSTKAIKLLDENGIPFGTRNADNRPRVSSVQYMYDVVLGNIPGHTYVYRFGYNSDVDDVREDVWEFGGIYIPPATPMQMRVVSSNANDTAAGTGARTVGIEYLDNTYTPQMEIVTLNGLTPVNTVATNILRINHFHVETDGSGGVAAGDISVQNTAGTVTYSYLSAGLNVARQVIYTVPAGKTLYITSWDWGVGSNLGNRYAEFLLRAMAGEDGALFANFHIRTMSIAQDGGASHELEIPVKVAATADVKVSAVSDSATANAKCYAGFAGWLE
jgi:hypothetical protein